VAEQDYNPLLLTDRFTRAADYAREIQVAARKGTGSSAVPTEDRVGLSHLETSPPTGPESVQHNPQESVAAVEAQATLRVLLEDRKLTKREDLRLQGSTGSKTGGLAKRKGSSS